jgi:hypothetical protein
VDGLTDGCGKVVFTSEYRYPGIPGAGARRVYEWDEGTLRNVGVVPGPSGETVVPAEAGTERNHFNVLSEDGSRVFFSAARQASDNPAEIGTEGVFVRENGTTTRDLSLSATSTPDTGATYQYAAPDGSRVFFLANPGLTVAGSAEGTGACDPLQSRAHPCDLYEYDLESSTLTDLSATSQPGGAGVGGFVGASDDGSHVYFAARGQLQPGAGKTLQENEDAHTDSLYSEVGGVISFVATIDEGDLSKKVLFGGGQVSVEEEAVRTASVSSSGRYLLFETNAKVTSYDNGGYSEAYLYDAEAESEAISCVSCRQDGKFPVAKGHGPVSPLRSAFDANPTDGPGYPGNMIVRNGEPVVFFKSKDRLAPGSINGGEGGRNLYEWAHGQVFFIQSDIPGANTDIDNPASQVGFGGASLDGTDLYFSTPRALTWEDGDNRESIYDMRVGGGYPQPSAPPPPCDSRLEGSCQGRDQAPAPAPAPQSATFSGPGNLKPGQQKKKPKKQKHKQKGKKHGKKKANDNRRAGK